MCSPATCPTCGKASYAGCGQHIEAALAGVPASKRCECGNPGPAPVEQAKVSASWLPKFLR